MFARLMCVCLSLVFLAGCGEKDKQQNGPKPLIVLTSPDNPPFEFKDTAQGEAVIGFDMDVVHELGKRLGRPVHIVEMDFAGLIPAIQAGRGDMAIAGFGPTDERRKSVDFSAPYHVDKKALLVLEDSTIASEKDLTDKKLGAQLGTTYETLANQWAGEMPGLSVVTLGKIGELVQELKNRRIQAIVVEDTVAGKIASSTPGLKTVILEVAGGPSAIVFPKGSPLVEPTNKALQEMKGNIETMEAKWFKQ